MDSCLKTSSAMMALMMLWDAIQTVLEKKKDSFVGEETKIIDLPV